LGGRTWTTLSHALALSGLFIWGSLIIARTLFEGNQPLQKSAIAGRRTTAPDVAAILACRGRLAAPGVKKRQDGALRGA
jgi:hypothetical protein